MTPPETPRNHVKPGYCCACGTGDKLYGGDSRTEGYRRRRFLLGDHMTTMAFCVQCAPRVEDNLEDLKAQLLDGWWQGLHGRVYRKVGNGWELRQVCPPLAESVIEQEWAKYQDLVSEFQVDKDYGTKTYAEVDSAEGIIN